MCGLIFSVFLVTCTKEPASNSILVQEKETPEWKCEPLPISFSEDDLVGTWSSVYGRDARKDTLTIRADGTYKQNFNNDVTGFNYESSWNAWKLEQKATGGIYIHFDGMRFCGFLDECKPPEDVFTLMFEDVCSGEFLSISEEMLLIVVGEPGFPPSIPEPLRGIALLHLRYPGSEGPPFQFTLVED